MKAYANGSISHQYFFDTNYFHLLLGLRSFQKSAFLKLTILFCQYFCCQNWDQWHKLSGKNTHIIFFYFLFKSTFLSRVLIYSNCRSFPYHSILLCTVNIFKQNSKELTRKMRSMYPGFTILLVYYLWSKYRL